MERVDYESLLISEVFQDNANGNLNINPWYQRRAVWSAPQKAYLVNTLFEQKPVPTIYVRHVVDIDAERSIKEIVDGQQRVRAILDFRADSFAARHPDHAGRRLRYSDLTRTEKQRFLSSKLSVGYLIEADDADVIEIFGRINSISKTLNPQEKRNALFSGDFKQFTLTRASELLPFWRSTQLFSDTDISRMMEVQFVSDLVYNMLEGLKDFSSPALTRIYGRYDVEFPGEKNIADRWASLFSRVTRIPPELFGRTVFKSYQVAFSLFYLIDNTRDRNWSPQDIATLMRRADDRMTDLMLSMQITDQERELLQSFHGGNLHRIRTRQIRDTYLRTLLAT
jgi:hypothetical protein